MHRRQFIAALGGLAALPLAAAGDNPVLDWRWRAEPVESDAAPRRYRLLLEARISEGYIIYGSDFEADLGPRPTRLRLSDAEALPVGGLRSVDARRRTDKVFRTEYTYFDGVAQLEQVVEVKPGVTRLSGEIRGQTCHEADGTCALFVQRFEVPLA